jgi:hypothetical protein
VVNLPTVLAVTLLLAIGEAAAHFSQEKTDKLYGTLVSGGKGALEVVTDSAAAIAKTPLTASELRELEDLTRQHAEAVKKTMELLGDRQGSVVRVKAETP